MSIKIESYEAPQYAVWQLNPRDIFRTDKGDIFMLTELKNVTACQGVGSFNAVFLCGTSSYKFGEVIIFDGTLVVEKANATIKLNWGVNHEDQK